MRLKEGPPLPPLPSPPPPSLPSVSALVSVQEEHVEPEEVDVDVDMDVETVHISMVGEEKFQTTDTMKRFRKACRDFYRETTKTCLFTGQQAFADKERWSNEPPYLSLCQNDVSKLMRDITDRASILVERVEYLDSALSSLVLPFNKLVYNNPHPFDGHSQKRVVTALERYRLVHNESFFKYHFTPTEFQTVVEDLTKKEKQLMAKARHESKNSTGQGGASAFRPVIQPGVAGTSAAIDALLPIPPEELNILPITPFSPSNKPPYRSHYLAVKHNNSERHQTNLIRQRFEELKRVLPFDPRKPTPPQHHILHVARAYIEILSAILQNEQSAENSGNAYSVRGWDGTATFLRRQTRKQNQR